ncbi:hypothetical protein F2Q69_00035838 [Brassica cretica]|uniref:Uncharacterized protein n=1 Tax=Brassica cretica TaxID=69181 RepID=A0A8S9S9H3_BRACR|nr:hypothetical protein F2Q69_00035838 [Brassica cretica]
MLVIDIGDPRAFLTEYLSKYSALLSFQVSSRKFKSNGLGGVVVFELMAPRGRKTAAVRGTAARVVREASPTDSVDSVNEINTETEGGNSARGSQQSDQPVGYADMMAELQGYRERFGDQMREEPTDGAPHQADVRENVPGVGVQHHQPPPPPPFVPVRV